MAKQGFFATGKRFYRIGRIDGLLHCEMIDSGNTL
jgi:hypothetical protein